MKNLFFFISFAMLVFNSCQKENAFEIPVNNESENNQKSEVKVVNGVLTFRDGNAFSNMSEILSNMNETELFKWEKSIGFKSYKRAFTEFNDKLNEAKTEEEFNRILDENKSLYKMNGDIIESLLPVEFYATLVNVERTYAVNTTKYTVDDKNIYIENGKKEFISYIVSNESDEQSKNIANGCPINAEVTQICDKRKILGTIVLYRIEWDGYDPITHKTAKLQQLKYEVHSRAYKKYFGNWHLYNTNHSFENIDLNIWVPKEVYNNLSLTHKYIWDRRNFNTTNIITFNNVQTATYQVPMGDVVYSGNSILDDPNHYPYYIPNFSLLNHYNFSYAADTNRASFMTTGTAACGWAVIWCQ